MDSSKTASSTCKREKGENAFWGEQVASARLSTELIRKSMSGKNTGSSSYLHLREERDGVCSWDEMMRNDLLGEWV